MQNKVVQYNDAYCISSAKFDVHNNTLKFIWCQGGLGCGIYCSKGKDAYLISKSSYSSPYDIIRREAWWRVSENTNYKVFISSASKISRDLVRNSGYQIVRDKTKANYIIIPSVKEPSMPREYNLGFKLESGDVHFLNVRRSDNAETWPKDDVKYVIDEITDRVPEQITDYFYEPDFTNFKVYFVRKCDEYREIYENTTTNGYYYAQDDNVGLTGSTSISIETLDVWRRIDSSNILEKSVLNSNWKRYPCTVAVFLAAEKSGYCNRPSGQWKWLLDQIDFGMFDRANTFGDKIVTPDDWNMLQRWILYRLGLGENGGFATRKIGDDLNYVYTNLIRSRLCYAPLFVTEESTFKNRLSDVGNS